MFITFECSHNLFVHAHDLQKHRRQVTTAMSQAEKTSWKMHAPSWDETLAQTATCPVARHALTGAGLCISKRLTGTHVCVYTGTHWWMACLRCWFVITSQRSSEPAALLVQAGCLPCQKLWVSNLWSMLPFPLHQHEKEWMDRQLSKFMWKAWVQGYVISGYRSGLG